MSIIYKVEDIRVSGEVVVSVSIGESYHSQSEFMPVEDLNDADKLKSFCEKLCAQAEATLEKIIATKIDPSSVTIDPDKVKAEKGKLQ